MYVESRLVRAALRVMTLWKKTQQSFGLRPSLGSCDRRYDEEIGPFPVDGSPGSMWSDLLPIEAVHGGWGDQATPHDAEKNGYFYGKNKPGVSADAKCALQARPSH